MKQIIHCEHCQKPIEDINTAMLFWVCRPVERTQSWRKVKETVIDWVIAHKGACDPQYQAAEGFSDYCEELDHLLHERGELERIFDDYAWPNNAYKELSQRIRQDPRCYWIPWTCSTL